jgi:magnesium-transporting ATPase (P-type)
MLTRAACRMHVWMLTGDKIETAEAVARTSGLVTEGMRVVTMKTHEWADAAKELESALEASLADDSNVLVIDGFTFSLARDNDVDGLVELCRKSRVVICAR